MTTHTPGPWHTAADAQNITTDAGALIARVALKQTVCGAPTANARLIAAAPELLAVLQALEWKAGNHVAALEAVGRTANGLKAACEAARQIIATATQEA